MTAITLSQWQHNQDAAESGLMDFALLDAAIAQIETAADAADLVKRIDALQAIYRAIGDSLETEHKLAIKRLEAIQRGGLALAALERGQAGRKSRSAMPEFSEYQQAIDSAGISERLARMWQEVAHIPTHIFDTYIDTCIEKSAEITMLGALRAAKASDASATGRGAAVVLDLPATLYDVAPIFGADGFPNGLLVCFRVNETERAALNWFWNERNAQERTALRVSVWKDKETKP